MTRRGLMKLKEWRDLLMELGYNREDREWFVDFWVAKHDADGHLLCDAAPSESEKK